MSPAVSRPLLAAAVALLALNGPAARAQPNASGSLERGAATQDPRESSPWLARPNPLRAFLPSATARVADQQARGEALLERRLSLLPGVRAAQVRLLLPERERAPLDRPLPPARAHVLLRADDPARPSQADVARVVAEALPELAPLELSLTRTPPARPPAPAPSVRVGPFWVAPASALPLRIALAACLLSNVVLACLLLLRWRRSTARRS
jgi:type III secretory pathway lipoprotein EscJ